MIYNIRTLSWDDKILNYLDIPKSILPKALPSSSEFGTFEYKGFKIPIRGVAGDQQAALFGQACFDNGMVKNTYGTGCFLLMNTGKNMRSGIRNLALLKSDYEGGLCSKQKIAKNHSISAVT